MNLLNDDCGSSLLRRYILSAKVSKGTRRSTAVATSLKLENMVCVACLEILTEGGRCLPLAPEHLSNLSERGRLKRWN